MENKGACKQLPDENAKEKSKARRPESRLKNYAVWFVGRPCSCEGRKGVSASVYYAYVRGKHDGWKSSYIEIIKIL